LAAEDEVVVPMLLRTYRRESASPSAPTGLYS
jgi:hypothetical protein